VLYQGTISIPLDAKSIPKEAFRNTKGVRYLKQLFYETTLEDKTTVIYTLKNRDHKGYLSLYRLYLELGDLTEYQFASTYLDGWDHWERLTKCEWFIPYITRWRTELSLKIESEILQRFAQIAQNPSAEGAFQANKILLDRVRKAKGSVKRGRPTQDEVNQEKTRLASLQAEVEDDLQRAEGVSQ